VPVIACSFGFDSGPVDKLCVLLVLACSMAFLADCYIYLSRRALHEGFGLQLFPQAHCLTLCIRQYPIVTCLYFTRFR
jgi:hypothetical protein